MNDLDFGRFVDHHCHGLVLSDLSRQQFEALMSEARHRSSLGTSLFDSMLGLSIRRWCAPVLGLEPGASPDVYLDRRRTLGGREASRRLVLAAGISTFLVDTGLGDDLVTPGEAAGLPSDSGREIVRLEALAQALLEAGVASRDFAHEFTRRLRVSSLEGAIGAKSIAAYRTGLDLPAVKPTSDALTAAVARVQPDGAGRVRIADPVIHGWLAWTAVELEMPLQFHVGYGDSDLDLLRCDPLHLTTFLRATEERAIPVLLLHNYPYHRQAAYLAQVFDQVFVDVGLATHNTGALSKHVLREVLELAPFGKLLFSTDAYALAELYLLGALLFRRGLGEVLGELVAAGEMSRTDASRVGSLVGHENARRVYRLRPDGAPVD